MSNNRIEEEVRKRWLERDEDDICDVDEARPDIVLLLAEVERLRALMPECPQCGLPYLDKACGPTHAALAEPMRRPGEAQRQRERAETVEAERDQLRLEIDRWQEESGLENSSGDPEGVTPDDLARHLQYLSKCEADLGAMEINHEQLMLACEELREDLTSLKEEHDDFLGILAKKLGCEPYYQDILEAVGDLALPRSPPPDLEPIPVGVHLSNKRCRNYYTDTDCPCPSGRCWYTEAKFAHARGEPAPNPTVWLKANS